MIDIENKHLWSMRFASGQQLASLPFPGKVTEEIEEDSYYMPQDCPARIPEEIGGQITVTLGGMGIFRVGRKEFNCVPGTAFCYRDCDPLVSYRCAPGHKWRFIWINFPDKSSERLIADINRNYGYFFTPGKKSQLETELFSYRKFAGSTLYLSPWEGAAAVVHLMSLLCGAVTSDATSGQRLVKGVKDEISHSFNEPISGRMLSKKLGVSREHLSKTFRQETGITLRDYRAGLRLEEACSMLLKTDLSCKEIAVLCHYGSYSAFFRAFRKVHGVSPEKFREGGISK